MQSKSQPVLSTTARLLILSSAFLGWMCAGFHLSITSLAMPHAVKDLLDRAQIIDRVEFDSLLKATGGSKEDPQASVGKEQLDKLQSWKATSARWFAWTQCAMLFGAACGGWLFGMIGDRWGRTKGMGLSILTYSVMSGVTSFASTPLTLLVYWFLACTGVGGMWPNGVALVAEAWSTLSRPVAAGVIGTAANIGIYILSTIAIGYKPSAESWQWMMHFGTLPVFLAFFALLLVPESPRWLAAQKIKETTPSASGKHVHIFRPPLLTITLFGIALATVPINGGWGSANWMVPWAGEAVIAAGENDNPLGEKVNRTRALTGIVGSFLGGWIASTLGRKQTYLLASVGALVSSQYTFWFVHPLDPSFLWWVAALGMFNGIYFGWMPYCLPEMFPTRARSAGAGVSFNFGRILTAVTVFTTGTLTQVFAGDFARIGRVTSLIFLVGIFLIYFMPTKPHQDLED